MMAWHDQAKFNNDNKENTPGWEEDVDEFLVNCYYLDRHMNRVHNKLKINKFVYGAIPLIGEIVILSEMSDIKPGKYAEYVVTWQNNYGTN